MIKAPNPNIQVFGPAGNNYGRDRFGIDPAINWWRQSIRKEKIEKIFNVNK